MSEIQRYRLKRKGPREITPDPDGFVVRVSDHERVVAGKDARMKRLAEGIERLAHQQADQFGNYIAGEGVSGEYREGRADGYNHAAALIRATIEGANNE